MKYSLLVHNVCTIATDPHMPSDLDQHTVPGPGSCLGGCLGALCGGLAALSQATAKYRELEQISNHQLR